MGESTTGFNVKFAQVMFFSSWDFFVVMMRRVSWSDGVGGSNVIGEQYNEPWVSNTAQYNVHVGE